MPTTVNIPDVGTVNFPDTMSESDIQTAIERDIVPKVSTSTSTPATTTESAMAPDHDKTLMSQLAEKVPQVISDWSLQFEQPRKEDTPEQAKMRNDINQVLKESVLKEAHKRIGESALTSTAREVQKTAVGVVESMRTPEGAALLGLAAVQPGMGVPAIVVRGAQATSAGVMSGLLAKQVGQSGGAYAGGGVKTLSDWTREILQLGLTGLGTAGAFKARAHAIVGLDAVEAAKVAPATVAEVTRPETPSDIPKPTETAPAPLTAEEAAKPVEVKPAPVKEIEPFGTVRQFEATEEFTNPADKGVYKPGDVITEGQLKRGGFEVPNVVETSVERGPTTSEEILGKALKTDNPVSYITGESKPLVSVGEKLDSAISKSNEPGVGGVEKLPFPTPKQKQITVGETTALKTVLRASEKAGEAGVETGKQIAYSELKPKIDDLNSKLSESVTKAKALNMYFSGQEKGSKIGASSAREQILMADKWWQATQEDIRKSLVGLAEDALPTDQRGKFLNAITSAMRRPADFKADPVGMYQRAAMVAARILNRADEVHRSDLIGEVKKIYNRASEASGVDAFVRRQIEDEFGHFEFKIRSNEMPVDALEAARDRLKSLEELGRQTVKARKAFAAIEQGRLQQELSKSETTPLERQPQFRAKPGDTLTLQQKLGNWWGRVVNAFNITDRGVLPMDASFDLLDEGQAEFEGFLHKNIRGPHDLAYQKENFERIGLMKPLDKIVKENKLTAQNMERIATYAYKVQPDLLNHLIETGVDPALIADLKLTPEEQSAYNYMRDLLDNNLRERLQSTKYRMDNKFFDEVENYFPVQRDAARFTGEPTAEDLTQGMKVGEVDPDYPEKIIAQDLNPRLRASAKKGFTIERKKNAAIPIRLNAYDVFQRHVNDALHYIHHAELLRRSAKLATSEEFSAKYGDMGTKIVQDWINTVARNGSVDRAQLNAFLDFIRTRTSVGLVGFRVASQLKHLSNIPIAVAQVGARWYLEGLKRAFTEEGQSFIKEYFSETLARSGAEPSIAETSRSRIASASFWLARNLDRANAQATALASYLGEMSKKGVSPDETLSMSIDPEAQRMALVKTRRSVASPLAKDVPQAISRGVVTGGNVSMARTLFQFGNVFLDQWSNFRLEFAHAGLPELAKGNPRMAAAYLTALSTVILLETGIKVANRKATQYAGQQLKGAITGTTPPEKHTKEDSFAAELGMDALRRIPFLGQLMNAVKYDGTGIPALDVTLSTARAGYQAVTGAGQYGRHLKPISQKRAAVKAVAGVAEVFGFPGAGQIGDIVQQAMK